MNLSAEPEVAGRLQRALGVSQKGQGMLLTAHRRLKDLPDAEVERFWAAQGERIEQHVLTAAAEVIAAYKTFLAAGLVANAGDHHFITEARRIVAEGG